MPKASININDFGRGINTVKNPRDLAIGESPNIVNFDTSNRGELRPRSYFNEQTNGGSLRLSANGVDAHTASINPGYGLYYFEADEATGVRGVQVTGTGSGSYTGTAGNNLIFDTTSAGNNTISINNNDFWTENNILSSATNFPIKIKISGSANNNGIFTVTNIDGDVNGVSRVGSTWNTGGLNFSNNKIFVSETVTDENVASGTQVTIERLGFVGDQLLALGNIDDNKVDVYLDSSDTWSTDKITVVNSLETNESPEYVFYYIDSSLRVADGNFKNESTPKWYGFIDRNQFQYNKGFESENVWRTIEPAFYEESNDLSPPTEFNIESTVNGTLEFPTSGSGWGIALEETDEEGEFSPGDYEFCGTFIYDGKQESLITKDNTNTKTLEGFKKIKFNVFANDNGTSRYARRVTGGRIYFREATSRDPWVLFADIDIRRGVRASLVDDYKGWIEDNVSSDFSGTATGQFRVTSNATSSNKSSTYWVLFSQRPNIDTYESINGYSPNDTKQIAFGKVGSGYKTAVVANRRTFVANVMYDDNTTSSSNDSTEFQHYGDRIMFSEVGKYDLFPNFNFIDVVKGDGEDYVKLESYADRLLAYKQRTLQILNISSPSTSNWFLETTIQEGGVQNPYSVCKGRGGVIWANTSGVYRYDGSSVKKVTDGKIKDSEWKTFSSSDTMSLGYIGNTDQVIIMKRADVSEDAYIYDLRSDSFTLSELIGPNSTSSFKPPLTNFVNDSIGKLIVGYDVESTDLGSAGANKVHFTAWNEGEGNHKIYKLETPDLSFAEPHRTKKVYKIYVHYKYTHSDNGIAYNEPITKSNVYYRANQRGSWKNVTSGSMENSENVLRNGNFDRYWLGWNDIFNDSSSNEITDWTFVSDGSGGRKAKFTATGSPSIVLTNKEIIDSGLTYNTKFTVSDYSAGNVKLNVGGVSGTARTANGTYSESFAPSSDGYLMVSCSNDFVGSIDDIIVRPTSSRESYGVAVFELEDGRGVRCQSMAFKIETSLTNASKLHINDIQVEYRVIQNRVF